MAKERPTTPSTLPVVNGPALPFPVVGVGASAGGLEALQDLFSGLSPDISMAFFVIQHLSPDFKSMMLEILCRHTTLQVQLAEDAMAVAPGHVYLIPPSHDLQLDGTRILLTPRQHDQGLHHPIDLFLASLARTQGDLGVAVILSGTGTDGANGARAVHNAGGRVIVQDPSTAKFDGMPRAAVGTGAADLVVNAFVIAEHLNDWTETIVSLAPSRNTEPLKQLFELVTQATRVDLSSYKEGTLMRRIQRRMQATDSPTMLDYVDRVASSEAELKVLSADLLIGVTEFFRDAPAWEFLATEILPELVRQHPDELRMWVCACSIGPEAYTLGILVLEAIRAAGLETSLRIFATDANPEAIKEAMNGTYDEELLNNVPDDYRERYFVSVGETWQVRRFLRDRITFAVHNVITDPPFTRLSLVTCRNMLIYLRQEAQRPVLSRLHFGLCEGGVLMLGASETVGDRKTYFQALDLKWKVFRAHGSSVELASMFGGAVPAVRSLRGVGSSRRVAPKAHMQAATDFYIPPGVAVDPAFEVQHFFGNVSPYVRLAEGRASLNLLNMLPPAVSVFVSSTARRVRASGNAALIPNVELGEARVNLRVMLAQASPIAPTDRGMLVFFEAPTVLAPEVEGEDAAPIDLAGASRERISRLEDELVVTRENLRTAVEDLEAANEELQATNEELIASNEELQSTNEELQSVNEELFSVNTEYQEKIEELEYLANDLENLLRSIDVGALFLDHELRVRRFNDTVLQLIPLKAQDIGRRFDDFTMRVDYPDMGKDLERVQRTSTLLTKELTDHDGSPWRLQIRPFDAGRRAERAGVIVTFHNATALTGEQQAIGDLAATALAAGLAGVGVIVVDTENEQTRLSPVARKVLGLERSAVFDYAHVRNLLEGELGVAPAGENNSQPNDALHRHRRPTGEEVLLRTFTQRATQATHGHDHVVVVLQEVR